MQMFVSEIKDFIFLNEEKRGLGQRQRGSRSEFRPGHLLSRLEYARFLSNPFQFIIHQSLYHSTVYSQDTDGFV
jgi:hypothetical protein